MKSILDRQLRKAPVAVLLTLDKSPAPTCFDFGDEDVGPREIRSGQAQTRCRISDLCRL